MCIMRRIKDAICMQDKNTRTHNIYQFSLFHGKNCYANVPQSYVIRTLPALYVQVYFLTFKVTSLFLNVKVINIYSFTVDWRSVNINRFYSRRTASYSKGIVGFLQFFPYQFLDITFNLQAPCVLCIGQAFRYSPENAFYIFNQQIYFIISYLFNRASLT